MQLVFAGKQQRNNDFKLGASAPGIFSWWFMASIVIAHPIVNNDEWPLDSEYYASYTTQATREWRAYLNGTLNRVETVNAYGSSLPFSGLNYDTGYTWYMEAWVDGVLIGTSNVETFHTQSRPGDAGDPPEKAIAPGPMNDETDVSRATNLTWRRGNASVSSYNVYFGPVDNLALVASGITNEYFSIQDYINRGIDPEDPTVYLDMDTEYEWRIDSFTSEEVEATGDTWSYTTRAQRTVVLSSPTNGVTDQLLPPFDLVWEIDGIGAQYGSGLDQDFLFIYLRKDDANFTEDNLVGNWVQAFYNDSSRVIRLSYQAYGATYYWQVQAANTAADLADSEVWSFTLLDFLPPAVSTHAVSGNITGANNMLTVRRLIAAANNKIWYEEDNEV